MPSPLSQPVLAALQAQLDGLTAAVEGALAVSKATDHDDDEAQQRTALLQQALGLVRSSAQAHGRASSRHTARSSGVTGGAKATETIFETILPPTPAHETMLPVVAGSLDPEEREARELEALRAQFAAGAAAEEEELDWSAPDDGGGGSDDEADAPSLDGAADDDAAARLLRALPASSSSSSAAAKVTNWESAEGYVPQGTPGFNEFAREQMRRAGVPCNPCVRPPAELVPAG
jgi:hypothetical protein